jgi:hypothetical protein
MFGEFFRTLFGIEPDQEVIINGKKCKRPRCHYCNKHLTLYEVKNYEDTCDDCYGMESEHGVNWPDEE